MFSRFYVVDFASPCRLTDFVENGCDSHFLLTAGVIWLKFDCLLVGSEDFKNSFVVRVLLRLVATLNTFSFMALSVDCYC